MPTSKVHAKSTRERRARRASALRRYSASPRGKYRQHKQNAKRRGIPFLLTFADWFELWEPYYAERTNRTADGYVMSRCGDEGAYERGNVVIKRHRENVAERNRIVAERDRAYDRWRREFETADWQHVNEGVEEL